MELKIKISQAIMAFIIAFWSLVIPIQGFIGIVIAAVLLDTMTGIAASVRKGGWHTLQSTKLFNVAVKLFFYMGVILLFFMIGTHVFEGEIMGIKYPLTKSITLVFLYIESKSFDENQKVFSGKSIAQWLRELYKNLKAIKKDFNDLSE